MIIDDIDELKSLYRFAGARCAFGAPKAQHLRNEKSSRRRIFSAFLLRQPGFPKQCCAFGAPNAQRLRYIVEGRLCALIESGEWGVGSGEWGVERNEER